MGSLSPLVATCLLLLLLPSLMTAQQPSSGDTAALIAFYDQLTLPGSLGWDTTSLCSQTGVTCSSSRVVNLDVGSSGLTGTVSTELGALTRLTMLNLSQNSLSGPIPTELGLLVDLTTLSLNDNTFTGPIPTQLGMLTSMEILTLSDNKLTGFIPWQLQIPGLLVLFLGGNSLCPIVNYSGWGTNCEHFYAVCTDFTNTTCAPGLSPAPCPVQIVNNATFPATTSNTAGSGVCNAGFAGGPLTRQCMLTGWNNTITGTPCSSASSVVFSAWSLLVVLLITLVTF